MRPFDEQPRIERQDRSGKQGHQRRTQIDGEGALHPHQDRHHADRRQEVAVEDDLIDAHVLAQVFGMHPRPAPADHGKKHQEEKEGV